MRDATLTTVAFAVALGWSLYQLAHGVSILVDGLLTHLSSEDAAQYISSYGLTWVVGRRVLSLDPMLEGLIEVVAVLALAIFVRSRIPKPPRMRR